MQCRRVLVTGCTVDVGDDAICLKGGAGAAGLRDGPCADILITGNTVYHGHGGFVIGSEFSGGMERIVVQDNTFSGTDTGLRFKSGPGRGGRTSSVFIRDIRMTDIAGEAIVFETGYADRPAGRENEKAAVSGVGFLPDFRDIHISRVTCRGARTAVAARGTLRTIHDIELTDSIFYAEQTVLLDDLAMIRMEGVRFPEP